MVLGPHGFQRFLDRIARVQRAPHMSHGLLVARSDVPGRPAPADGVAADVALARGTVEDADVEAARGGEVALQVHVQILADRFGPRVPAADVAG